jgi:long-subunit acyl-CoA synthetase (AMP-forming)
MKPLIDSKNEY